MPVKPFRDLFHAWPSNEVLSIQQLRMKAITLLALTFMLRPSDIAPKAEIFNSEDYTTSPIVFSLRDVTFHDEGSMSIMYHGTKNDTVTVT